MLNYVIVLHHNFAPPDNELLPSHIQLNSRINTIGTNIAHWIFLCKISANLTDVIMTLPLPCNLIFENNAQIIEDRLLPTDNLGVSNQYQAPDLLGTFK